MAWNDLCLRMRALFFQSQTDRDLQEELESHLALQTLKNVAQGRTKAEAARLARVQFGGVAQVSEECRDLRGIRLLTTTAQDVRYALRSFRRTPIFALTVVGTIALGLGLDTALFSIFNTYYFQKVPVRAPEQLYECSWVDAAGKESGFKWGEYRAFLAGNPAFAEALAYRNASARMDGHDLAGTLVTGGYFQTLGVSAALGRVLNAEDSAYPGGGSVVVLSDSAWQNHFAGDRRIVGKKIFLRGYPFEVVGVARPGFTGLGARVAAFWAPITMAARFEAGPDLFGADSPRNVSIVGRLNTESTARDAREELTAWVRSFGTSGSSQSTGVRGVLTSRATYKPLNPANALLFAPILAAFSLVLLIGCANVANMLLARGLSRQREIGIRLCLGADRRRLVRQLLTESLLLSLPAAGAGFLLAYETIRLCRWLLDATLPPGIRDFATRLPPISPDFRVFGFALAFALISTLLFGLIPALQATRTDIVQPARGDPPAGVRPVRLRNHLVVGQITICVALLISAGILLTGIKGIRGFDGRLSSKESILIAIQERFRMPVVDRLSSDKDLEIIATGRQSPVDRKPALNFAPSDGGAMYRAFINTVSVAYFRIFEIPIVQGRGFNDEESDSRPPVVVISRTAARRFWPSQEAVGRTLQLAPEPKTEITNLPRSVIVIGVAEDEVSRWIANGEDKALVYFPGSTRTAGTELFVRARGNAEAKRRKLDADLAVIDPLAVDGIQQLQIKDWVAEETYTFRVAYWLSGAIGILALLLTLSGIYGVLAFSVSQRTQEIGVRMALGATTRAVTGVFVKQSAGLGLVGSILGCIVAAGISRLLASVLVASNTFDSLVYIGVVLMVLAACAAAAFFPLRKAIRIDPVVSLRYD